jgi:hypothetical protein
LSGGKQNITQITSLSSINPLESSREELSFSWEVSFGEAQRKPSFHIFSLQDIPSPGTVRPSGPELVQEEISLVDLDT